FMLTPTSPPQIYTPSLHDALPLSEAGEAQAPGQVRDEPARLGPLPGDEEEKGADESPADDPADDDRDEDRGHHDDELLTVEPERSEEHTSELQSRRDLVCRLLLEK